MDFLRRVAGTIAGYVREKFPANRMAVLFGPLASGAAASVVTWLAANVPGAPVLDANWLAGIFLGVLLVGWDMLRRFMARWQEWEREGDRAVLERVFDAEDDPNLVGPTHPDDFRVAEAPEEPPGGPRGPPAPSDVGV